MPYKTTDQLPESIKNTLPKGAQDIFLNVVNSQLESGLDEEGAMASAWAAVKRSYEKDEGGEWVEIDKQSDGTYVSMRVKNNKEFAEWFKNQGADVLPTEELHTTIAFSRKPFSIFPSAKEITVMPDQLKSIEPLGDDGAIVLKMECEELQKRFNDCMEAGATYDYDDYIPHITITYNGEGLDLSNISKPDFPIVLHKETVEALNLDWKEDLDNVSKEEDELCKELAAMHTIEKAEYQGREVELNKPFRTPGESKKFAVYVQDGDVVKIVRFGDPDMEIRRDDPEARANFRARHSCDEKKDKTTAGYWSCLMWSEKPVSDIVKRVEIKKANDDKRIVYAWAYVCSVGGEQVIDHSRYIVEEEEMERMAYDFIDEYRDGGEMHNKRGVASAVASMPFTRELQHILGIDIGKVGWFVAFRVNDDEVWQKIKDGTYRMMSIGGKARREKIVH